MKFFSLLYQGELHPSLDKKVIPASEFSKLVTAMQILEKAKEDAEIYRKETEKHREETSTAAKKEGFDEGLSRFNEHLIHFDQELKKMRHEIQQTILPLALKAAKKIVAKELELHPETIVDIVLKTIAPITQNRRFVIYVNKGDKEILEAQRSRIKDILEHLDSLSIQEKSDIQPGGCIIETESGIINAEIENQWRALEAAFEKYMKR